MRDRSLNPKHKKSLLDIPEQGATTSTLAKLWGLSIENTAALLIRHKGILVRKAWSQGFRVWKLLDK